MTSKDTAGSADKTTLPSPAAKVPPAPKAPPPVLPPGATVTRLKAWPKSVKPQA